MRFYIVFALTYLKIRETTRYQLFSSKQNCVGFMWKLHLHSNIVGIKKLLNHLLRHCQGTHPYIRWCKPYLMACNTSKFKFWVPTFWYARLSLSFRNIWIMSLFKHYSHSQTFLKNTSFKFMAMGMYVGWHMDIWGFKITKRP